MMKVYTYLRRSRLRPVCSGFTLIELLVVIAVIAVLAAILVPVLGKVRASTHSAVCVSNLRQSSSSLLLHAVSHGNRLDLKAGGSGGSSQIWSYVVAEMLEPKIAPLITSRKMAIPSLNVMYCPSFFPYRNDPKEANWMWSAYGLFALEFDGYGTKELITDSNGSVYSTYSLNLYSVDKPAKHPLLMDSVQVSMNPPSQRMSIRTYGAALNQVSPHMRHGGRAHVAFLDGSVAGLGAEELETLGFSGAVGEDLQLISF